MRYDDFYTDRELQNNRWYVLASLTAFNTIALLLTIWFVSMHV